jgi:branched-subunit amino acid ABC-type transport system permease component
LRRIERAAPNRDFQSIAPVLSSAILIPAVLNGLLIGAIYALVALGLTLIYGVLHIINFAHGALLSAALFAVFFPSGCLALIHTLPCFCLRRCSLWLAIPCSDSSSVRLRMATTATCCW